VVADGLFATAPAIAKRDAASRLMGKLGIGVPAGRPGVIRPGDTVWLMSGDQGAVKLQGYYGAGLVGYANADFISVAAAPGQTPILRSLEILGGSKWVFRGITFQSLNDTASFIGARPAPKDHWLISLSGPHGDIVFDGNHLQSSNDVSKWSMDDWRRKRASGIADEGGNCITITGNSFKNVGFGILTQNSDRVLIAGNSINYFSDDGIDYGSSDMLIEHNRITNSIEDGDLMHRDGMQGQPGKPWTELAEVHNITIRDNLVIRVTDRNLAHPGALQGIDAFDGVWNNVEVSGNTVIVDEGHGISYYGVHGARITNNIVLGDGGKVLPCLNLTFEQCERKPDTIQHNTTPKIIISQSKIKIPSSNILIEGNITTGIVIGPNNANVRVRDNLCVPTAGKCPMGIPIEGKIAWVAYPGVYGDKNVIANSSARWVFVLYDPSAMKYDLRLRRKNPAAP
jgi:hypothetical protein